jgi:hypothetical protein
MYGFDYTLGWVLRDGQYQQRHHDFAATYTVCGGRRVVIGDEQQCSVNIYGDSFVFGIGVGDEDTVPSMVSSRIGCVYGVRNCGVSGYGPDQYRLLRDKVSRQGDIDVYVILTGNDYMDMTSRTDNAGSRHKPYLSRMDSGFEFEYPSGDQPAVAVKESLSLYSLTLMQDIGRLIPAAVSVRNAFVEADADVVGEAMDRMRFIFSDCDRDRTVFIVVPSVALASGVSRCDTEGLFGSELNKWLDGAGYRYVSLIDIMTRDDYWPNEGHPNVHGNAKIADAIVTAVAKPTGVR